jgi:hypothetical protein
VAVTEALHHFIGHAQPTPLHPARYLAATAAHITYMLRDTGEDSASGYFNVPREVLEEKHISPQDVTSDAYRAWVRTRWQARQLFQRGGGILGHRRKRRRCRAAGLAYVARFTGLLDTIERSGLCPPSCVSGAQGLVLPAGSAGGGPVRPPRPAAGRARLGC